MEQIFEGTILKLFNPRSIQFAKKKGVLDTFRLHSSITDEEVNDVIGNTVTITVLDNEVISIDRT